MNALTQRESAALPSMHVEEKELIDVLRNSLYPGAQDASIKLVLSYCKASGLDPMQKPVHIVPMSVSTGRKDEKGWDIKEMRDVIMPGIGLYRTQAARSGQYAGVSEPEFGPIKTLTFIETIWEDDNGRRSKRQQNVELEYPEWCRVTVERQVGETVRRFTAREYWLENYATKGAKSQEPNAMWRRRPYGQLAKCAEAQALRKAFPEFGAQATADELEGKQLDDDSMTIEMAAPKQPVEPPRSKSEKRGAPADVMDVDPKPQAQQQELPAQAPIDAKPISDSALRVLKTKMENASVSEADVKKKFGFDLDGITTANYNGIVDWLKDPTQ
jgi:phage recombination protein Bet